MSMWMCIAGSTNYTRESANQSLWQSLARYGCAITWSPCCFTELPVCLNTDPVLPPPLHPSPNPSRPPNSVGPVPGRPVPGHGWSWPGSGSWGVVRREKRRPHPDLAQRRLRVHQEPRPQSGQGQRPGDQTGSQSRAPTHRPQARLATALSSERKRKSISLAAAALITFLTVSSRRTEKKKVFSLTLINRARYYGWSDLGKLGIST